MRAAGYSSINKILPDFLCVVLQHRVLIVDTAMQLTSSRICPWTLVHKLDPSSCTGWTSEGQIAYEVFSAAGRKTEWCSTTHLRPSDPSHRSLHHLLHLAIHGPQLRKGVLVLKAWYQHQYGLTVKYQVIALVCRGPKFVHGIQLEGNVTPLIVQGIPVLHTMFCRVGGVDSPSSFKTVTSSASYPNESAQRHVLAENIDAILSRTDEEVAKIVHVLERATESIVGMFSECLIIANPDTQRTPCHDYSRGYESCERCWRKYLKAKSSVQLIFIPCGYPVDHHQRQTPPIHSEETDSHRKCTNCLDPCVAAYQRRTPIVSPEKPSLMKGSQ